MIGIFGLDRSTTAAICLIQSVVEQIQIHLTNIQYTHLYQFSEQVYYYNNSLIQAAVTDMHAKKQVNSYNEWLYIIIITVSRCE